MAQVKATMKRELRAELEAVFREKMERETKLREKLSCKLLNCCSYFLYMNQPLVV